MTNEELMSIAAEMSQNGGGNHGEVAEPQEEEETQTTEAHESMAEQESEPSEAPIETAEVEAQEEPAPQADTKYEELLQKLSDMEAQLKQYQAPQAPEESMTEELSEEDMAMMELKKRMGFDDITGKLSKAMEVIDQMTQREAVMQKQIEVDAEISKFKAEYPSITEDKLVEFIKSQPPERAQLYSSPTGWRMAADHMVAMSKPSATPDPITPSQSPVDSGKDAFKRLKSGEDVSRIDIGRMILGMSNH